MYAVLPGFYLYLPWPRGLGALPVTARGVRPWLWIILGDGGTGRERRNLILLSASVNHGDVRYRESSGIPPCPEMLR